VAFPGALVPGVAEVASLSSTMSSAVGTRAARSRTSISAHIASFPLLARSIPVPAASPKDSRAITAESPETSKRTARLHGRVERPQPVACEAPGCSEIGEFRAPRSNRVPGSEGGWQFLCLDHVRAFNTGYNFFDGLSPDEIHEA